MRSRSHTSRQRLSRTFVPEIWTDTELLHLGAVKAEEGSAKDNQISEGNLASCGIAVRLSQNHDSHGVRTFS